MDYTKIFQRCEGYCRLILLPWPEGRSRVVRFADVDIPLWHWVLSKLQYFIRKHLIHQPLSLPSDRLVN